VAAQYSEFRSPLRALLTFFTRGIQTTLTTILGSLGWVDFVSGGDVRKSIGMMALLTVVLAMAGCGSSSSSSTNVNGNWSASLTNSPLGPTVYTFTTTLAESSGGGVSVSSFTITSANGSCFTGTTTESGSFTLSGNFSGNVTGTFGMTITAQDSGGQNVLMLQGGVGPNNTITGNWSVTGTSACVGQGTFTMNKT
jgi:hypothetical protein